MFNKNRTFDKKKEDKKRDLNDKIRQETKKTEMIDDGNLSN